MHVPFQIDTMSNALPIIDLFLIAKLPMLSNSQARGDHVKLSTSLSMMNAVQCITRSNRMATVKALLIHERVPRASRQEILVTSHKCT